MSSQNQNRRAFLGTIGVAAAAASVAIPGQVDANLVGSLPKATTGEAFPLWEIIRKADEHVDTEGLHGYALSKVDARHRVAKESNSCNRYFARGTIGRFPGNFFRMAMCSWNSYRHDIARIAEFRKEGTYAQLLSGALDEAARVVGWDKARVERDIRAFEKAGGDACKKQGWEWICACEPSHVLDIPDPIMSGDNSLDSSDFFTSRADVLQAVAAWNAEQLESDDPRALGHWVIALEIGDELPGTNYAMNEFCGDVAIETFSAERLVRVVRPIAEEIAQYASVEGGAS